MTISYSGSTGEWKDAGAILALKDGDGAQSKKENVKGQRHTNDKTRDKNGNERVGHGGWLPLASLGHGMYIQDSFLLCLIVSFFHCLGPYSSTCFLRARSCLGLAQLTLTRREAGESSNIKFTNTISEITSANPDKSQNMGLAALRMVTAPGVGRRVPTLPRQPQHRSHQLPLQLGPLSEGMANSSLTVLGSPEIQPTGMNRFYHR